MSVYVAIGFAVTMMLGNQAKGEMANLTGASNMTGDEK
jgi:hypothetical protein